MLFVSCSASALAGALCVSALLASPQAAQAAGVEADRVLLISIDGMHELDLTNYIAAHPTSTMARLVNTGIHYTNASSSKPADSFPGLLAMVTGGGPRSTGVFYDDTWDRTLFPHGTIDCTGTPPGAEAPWTAVVDDFPTHIDAVISVAKLPLKSVAGVCTPVFPHDYLRVNTVFEVIKAHGGRTAWADKHPSYDILQGPSGTGVDDLFTPEVDATATVPPPLGGTATISKELQLTLDYDDTKVAAIINEINGKDHTGTNMVGVPTIFGMNFGAINQGQKLVGSGCELAGVPVTCGYVDAAATPYPGLAAALDHTDASLGQIVAALSAKGILKSTLIILTAKHGQVPIDPTKLVKISPTIAVADVGSANLAQQTADAISLLWLRDQTQTATAAAALTNVNADQVLSGSSLTALFNDPLVDPRTPDIIVVPQLGTIYSTSGAKKMEHGGFTDDDIHVPIVLSKPSLTPAIRTDRVELKQIACTILEALDSDCDALAAARMEDTKFLPGTKGKK